MSRTPNAVPVYRLHKPTGQAVCTVHLLGGGRRDLYLGKHNSAASRAEYNRIVALVASNGGIYPAATPDVTVNELLLAYFQFADGYYRAEGGQASPTAARLKQSLRGLRKLFGPTPAAEFGPKALKSLTEAWVGDGLSRKTVNARIGIVKRLFRWAVAEELVTPDTHQRLLAVEGLRAGRTTAPDNPPVRPAVWSDVELALAHMPAHVAAVVRLQVLTGARGGELLKLRSADLDRTNPATWAYTPPTHKGTWKGKERVVYFGKRSQEVLAPFLAAADPTDYLFSPARAEAERNAERGEMRKTPRYESHMRRNADKRVGERRRRPPGARYTAGTYRQAVERACARAGVPVFTPHRLRHLAATRTREELGVDVARALLGHSLAAVTEVYSREVDKQLALKAVEKFG